MRCTAEETHLQTDGKDIFLRAFFPESAERVPAVLFSHGFNGSGDDFAGEAAFLAENGIAAVTFDFCGGSARSRSGGDTREMTVATEKDDLLAVFAALRADGRADEKNLFLFGGSQGGLVSALAAEELRERVRGLILLYPAFCIPDDWRKAFPREEDIPDSYPLWGMTLGRAYFAFARSLHIERALGGYAGPVLLLHGEEDTVVPAEYAKRAASLYANARFLPFAGEGHGFSADGMRAVRRLLFGFLAEHRA